jgi:hypothetical protein
MIRWTFGFKEYPIHVTTELDSEDMRIKSAIQKPSKLLSVEGTDGLSLYLNLAQTNVILRQVVTPENPGFNLPYPEKDPEKALPDVEDGPVKES